MVEWIDIRDEMPEPGTNVLVYTKDSYCPVKVARWTINYRWQGVRASDITHWAQLPPPPF